jgi:hypothetical protein
LRAGAAEHGTAVALEPRMRAKCAIFRACDSETEFSLVSEATHQQLRG